MKLYIKQDIDSYSFSSLFFLIVPLSVNGESICVSTWQTHYKAEELGSIKVIKEVKFCGYRITSYVLCVFVERLRPTLCRFCLIRTGFGHLMKPKPFLPVTPGFLVGCFVAAWFRNFTVATGFVCKTSPRSPSSFPAVATLVAK